MWFRRKRSDFVFRSVVLLLVVAFVLGIGVMFQTQREITRSGGELSPLLPPSFSPTSTTRSFPRSIAVDDGVNRESRYDRGVLEARLEATLASCNRDLKNNVDRHVGCFVVRNAVFWNGRVRFHRSENAELPQEFPGRLSAPSRHHMRSISLQAWRDADEERQAFSSTASTPTSMSPNAIAMRNVTLAYYQAPVIGAQYRNAWHTFGDFFTMLHHTVAPLMYEGNSTRKWSREVIPPLWWLTRTARTQLRKDCASQEQCQQSVLFDPFAQLFEGRVSFVDVAPQSPLPLRVEYLLIGLNSRCSPIPTDDVEIEECHVNLELVRDRVLAMYGHGPQRAVTEAERKCPQVHIMSRQGDHYRHMTPFNELLQHLTTEFNKTFEGCPLSNLQVIKLTSKMPFVDQILSLRNVTVLWAGRGGGTAYSIFLPTGGVYISISGSDRWSPYRGLVPRWIHMTHQRAKLVHPDDWRRPPPVFRSKSGSYTDPNRAAYLVKHPALFAKESVKLMKELLSVTETANSTSVG